MFDALSYEFMRNALAAGILASIACGMIGALVAANRLTFLAGGVAHAAYGGVGLAMFTALPVVPVTGAFTVCAGLVMGAATRRRSERSDIVVGVLWASGMAVGVILLDLTPGYKADLMSYLFGSILTVPSSDLLVMAILDAFLAATVMTFYNALAAVSFDREFAEVRGLPVFFLHYLLPVMIALSVVMIIRVTGLILVIALLTAPAYMAGRRARSLGGMMVLCALYNAFFCLAGLCFSYYLDLTSGACIIAVAAICFFLSLAYGTVRNRLAAAAGKGA